MSLIMTRINANISPRKLTDEHLLAEHREIKRIANYAKKAIKNGGIKDLPKTFKLGKGHVLFLIDKQNYLYNRYKDLFLECKRRCFDVTNYCVNWNGINDVRYWKKYEPTDNDNDIIRKRIKDRILNSKKRYWHYEGKQITKEIAISLLD